MRLTLNGASLRRQIWLNRLHSALLLGGLGLLAAAVGLLVAGPTGLLLGALTVALILALIPTPGGAVFRHVLGARPLAPRTAPGLHALVDELARRAALPHPPALFLLPAPNLQAMASGDHARPAIALTPALLTALPPREVAAVLAHEIAHIRHRDLSIMRLAALATAMTRGMATLGLLLLLVWLPSLAATGAAPWPGAFLLLLLAPGLGELLSLSLSRRREYMADAGAVALTGDPQGLAAALLRLDRLQGDDWERLGGRPAPAWLRWFRTHPTIRERVVRLMETTQALPDPPAPPMPWGVLQPSAPPPLPPRHALRRAAQRWWM